MKYRDFPGDEESLIDDKVWDFCSNIGDIQLESEISTVALSVTG